MKDKLKKISAPQPKRRLSVQLDEESNKMNSSEDDENEVDEIPIVSAEPLDQVEVETDEYLEEEKNIQHFLSKHTAFNMLSQKKLSSDSPEKIVDSGGIAQESKMAHPPQLSPEKQTRHSQKYSAPTQDIELDLDSDRIEIRKKKTIREAVSPANIKENSTLKINLQKSNHREENTETKSKLNQSKKKSKKAQEKDYQGAILSQAGTAEPYIRRTIATLGWKEVPNTSDKFHIKFDVLDEGVKVGSN